MKFLPLALILFTTSALFGQIGASGKYILPSEDGIMNGSGWQVGLNYWFRHKKVRLEFFPEISYSRRNSDRLLVELGETLPGLKDPVNQWGVAFPVSIYPLDFVSDCICPTFSKQSLWFQKGFFLQIIPAYHYIGAVGEESLGAIGNESFFTAGAATGVDLGISDLLTVAPLLSYHRNFVKENYAATTLSLLPMNELRVGLRLQFRFDKENY